MKLEVSKEAAQWFINEMYLEKGDSIKFFGKVYGENGFSFALDKVEPSRPEIEIEVEGINFYIEKSDAWFFIDSDLIVTLDEKLKEPKYNYVKK
jgi:uncharacterized protein YneR